MEKLHEYLNGKNKGDFASSVGISASYLSQILSGHRRPNYNRMCQIETATDGFVTLNDWRQDA